MSTTPIEIGDEASYGSSLAPELAPAALKGKNAKSWYSCGSWKAGFSVATGLLAFVCATGWVGTKLYQRDMLASYYGRSALHMGKTTCSTCAVIFPSRWVHYRGVRRSLRVLSQCCVLVNPPLPCISVFFS